MADLIIAGDQAYTPEEYAAYRKERDRENARRRYRLATDLEYRERQRLYIRDWYERHRDEVRDYQREYMRQRRARQRALRLSGR